jgi:hypothetical protein
MTTPISVAVSHNTIRKELAGRIGALPTMGPMLIGMLGPDMDFMKLVDELLEFRGKSRKDVPPMLLDFLMAIQNDKPMELTVKFPGTDYTLNVVTESR